MSKLKAIFGAVTPKAPKAPEALPPVPTREDPAIETARKKQQSSERLRRGRKGSILTSSAGVEEDASILRPGARSAKLLGK